MSYLEYSPAKKPGKSNQKTLKAWPQDLINWCVECCYGLMTKTEQERFTKDTYKCEIEKELRIAGGRVRDNFVTNKFRVSFEKKMKLREEKNKEKENDVQNDE